MQEKRIDVSVMEAFPEEKKALVDQLLKEAVDKSRFKIVALDDDPTGVQTVHGVHVYTDWTEDSIRAGFNEENKLFFILTNSRGFTAEQTKKAHTEIAERIQKIYAETGIPYLIISRSDSTLRGHFPLETETLRQVYEKKTGGRVDGEILAPYFFEGGRFTLNNVHYVKYGRELVPAGETEFAKDETFGYTSSNMGEYIEEKTKGEYKASDVTFITLTELRTLDLDGIEGKIEAVHDFRKIVVNATDDYDVKVFAIALYRALAKGRHFLIRSAAAMVKAMGNISTIPLLTKKDMVFSNATHGGVIVVGSHTKKTTAQLEMLKSIESIHFIEMNSDLVLKPGALEEETRRILREENEYIEKGITVCVSTKRQLLKVENDTPEEALLRSVAISDAVQKCVGELTVAPSFVVAKGGITSSDVGIKALRVKRATVLGQIQPGVPVWGTDDESRFPGIPYVIFPGNVGEAETLRNAVQILMG